MRGYITDPDQPGGLRLADDLPEPTPAADEMLVGVRAYSVNRGELSLIPARPRDWRPGQDLSGVVVRGRTDGSGPPAGTRVVGVVDAGSWSERVAVPTAWASTIPDAVSFEQAAALPVAGLTAYRAILRAGGVLGREVLVLGATGGVGQFAVQLATAAGARVTAQVSSMDRANEVRTLGAESVTVDVSEDDRPPFDVVLAGVLDAPLANALRRVRPGGVVLVYGATGEPVSVGPAELLGSPNTRIVGMIGSEPEDERGRDLRVLAGMIGDGRLDPVLGETRDWSDTVAVLDALRQRRVRGKAILTIPAT